MTTRVRVMHFGPLHLVVVINRGDHDEFIHLERKV